VTPDVVVDIGNSRMKWGRCEGRRVTEMVSLTVDEPAAWTIQATTWGLKSPLAWAVASVNPDATARFLKWTAGTGDSVLVLDDHRAIPLHYSIDSPERVGIDRLLNAFAAHTLAAPQPAVAVSVGTAATIDLVDGSGTFLGGVIFPGPRLMAESLHSHTAKLPLVDAATLPTVVAPGKNTSDAILAGIRAAIVGGVALVVTHFADLAKSPWVFITGGAAGDLGGFQFGRQFAGTRFVPTLTLDGIRIAAEALP
jgi:type III pantothenate kinase